MIFSTFSADKELIVARPLDRPLPLPYLQLLPAPSFPFWGFRPCLHSLLTDGESPSPFHNASFDSPGPDAMWQLPRYSGNLSWLFAVTSDCHCLACATQVTRKWQKTEAMLSRAPSFLLLDPLRSEMSAVTPLQTRMSTHRRGDGCWLTWCMCVGCSGEGYSTETAASKHVLSLEPHDVTITACHLCQ